MSATVSFAQQRADVVAAREDEFCASAPRCLLQAVPHRDAERRRKEVEASHLAVDTRKQDAKGGCLGNGGNHAAPNRAAVSCTHSNE